MVKTRKNSGRKHMSRRSRRSRRGGAFGDAKFAMRNISPPPSYPRKLTANNFTNEGTNNNNPNKKPRTFGLSPANFSMSNPMKSRSGSVNTTVTGDPRNNGSNLENESEENIQKTKNLLEQRKKRYPEYYGVVPQRPRGTVPSFLTRKRLSPNQQAMQQRLASLKPAPQRSAPMALYNKAVQKVSNKYNTLKTKVGPRAPAFKQTITPRMPTSGNAYKVGEMVSSGLGTAARGVGSAAGFAVNTVGHAASAFNPFS